MNFTLISEITSKRADFFLQAAKLQNMSVTVIPYPPPTMLSAFDISNLNMIKLDPPVYNNPNITDIYSEIAPYISFWKRIGQASDIRCLNSIDSIINTLDKQTCKSILMEAGIPCTPLLPQVSSIESLRKMLLQLELPGAFIKPRWGSGAAGVLAYRLPSRGRPELLCTSAKMLNGQLMNTKHLYTLSSSKAIEEIVNQILSQDTVIEKWLPKAKFRGRYFDLRILYQFDKIVYTIARQSTGVITNLHLNNSPMEVSFLPTRTLDEIAVLCGKAAKLFPGLRVSGMDILLEPGTYTPYIIEINAQGDLIYQDIYADNSIYADQVRFISCLKRRKSNDFMPYKGT
ncbi:MAG: STM4014 family protein [Defluviitaleaceae bacterium]|nr:STM4014 family protein [Defluviitaleaceae bacterium]